MNHRVYCKANTFISVKGNVYNNAGKRNNDLCQWLVVDIFTSRDSPNSLPLRFISVERIKWNDNNTHNACTVRGTLYAWSNSQNLVIYWCRNQS